MVLLHVYKRHTHVIMPRVDPPSIKLMRKQQWNFRFNHSFAVLRAADGHVHVVELLRSYAGFASYQIPITHQLKVNNHKWAHSKLQSFQGQLKCTVNITGAILLVPPTISSLCYPMGELAATPTGLQQHGSSTLLQSCCCGCLIEPKSGRLQTTMKQARSIQLRCTYTLHAEGLQCPGSVTGAASFPPIAKSVHHLAVAVSSRPHPKSVVMCQQASRKPARMPSSLKLFSLSSYATQAST